MENACPSCNTPVTELYLTDAGKMCKACYVKGYCSKCKSCGEYVIEGGVKVGEDSYHADHLVCSECKESLLGQSIFLRDGLVVCEKHAHAPISNDTSEDLASRKESVLSLGCRGCGKAFGPTDGYCVVSGEKYHESCLVCAADGAPLLGVPIFLHDGKPYCKVHFNENFSARCSQCGKPPDEDEGNNMVMIGNKPYHNGCFRCVVCKTEIRHSVLHGLQPIDGKRKRERRETVRRRTVSRSSSTRVSVADDGFDSDSSDEEHTRSDVVEGADYHFVEGSLYCDLHFTEKFLHKCEYCQDKIRGTTGISVVGRYWHENHLRCGDCDLLLIHGTGGGVFFEDEKTGAPLCEMDFNRRSSKTCFQCSDLILPGSQFYAFGEDTHYHEDCFTCHTCGTKLKAYFSHEEQLYCETHYLEARAEKCGGCGKPLLGTYVEGLGKKWHVDHFKCATCDCSLHPTTAVDVDGVAYCKSHVPPPPPSPPAAVASPLEVGSEVGDALVAEGNSADVADAASSQIPQEEEVSSIISHAAAVVSQAAATMGSTLDDGLSKDASPPPSGADVSGASDTSATEGSFSPGGSGGFPGLRPGRDPQRQAHISAALSAAQDAIRAAQAAQDAVACALRHADIAMAPPGSAVFAQAEAGEETMAGQEGEKGLLSAADAVAAANAAAEAAKSSAAFTRKSLERAVAASVAAAVTAGDGISSEIQGSEPPTLPVRKPGSPTTPTTLPAVPEDSSETTTPPVSSAPRVAENKDRGGKKAPPPRLPLPPRKHAPKLGVETVELWREVLEVVPPLIEFGVDITPSTGAACEGGVKHRRVMAASLNQLVALLAGQDAPEATFRQAFFMYYRSFTTPKMLLEKLTSRFRVPKDAIQRCRTRDLRLTLDTLGLNAFRMAIQGQVISAVQMWLATAFAEDFEKNAEMLTQLEEFVITLRAERSPMYASAVETLVHRLKRGLHSTVVVNAGMTHIGGRPPKSLMPRHMNHLFDVEPLEIARQLTLLDFELFSKINVAEFVDLKFAKADKATQSPNIVAMTDRFNKTAFYFATHVVTPETKKQRTRAVRKCIKIASALLKLHNFCSFFAVMAALNNSAVHRLQHTLDDLNASKDDLLERLREVTDPMTNYKNYRSVMKKSSPPLIPYLGVAMTDLTFVVEGNPNKITRFADPEISQTRLIQQDEISSLPSGLSSLAHECELINMDKRLMEFEILRSQIVRFQEVSYNLKKVPELCKLIDEGMKTALTDEQLYDLSLKREPRGCDYDDIP
eukprot:Rmarinus@m.16880